MSTQNNINAIFEAGAPAELTVSEMVDGFATALQNMHPGDRWEIWIPQQMGYGSAGRSASGSVIIKVLAERS